MVFLDVLLGEYVHIFYLITFWMYFHCLRRCSWM